MKSDYTPKSEGETLLRHQIARMKARISKFEKEGKEYPNQLLTIPYDQAKDLVDKAKKRKEKIETVKNLAGELSFQLDGEYVDYNVTGLRNLANKVLVALSEIK